MGWFKIGDRITFTCCNRKQHTGRVAYIEDFDDGMPYIIVWDNDPKFGIYIDKIKGMGTWVGEEEIELLGGE